MPKLFIRGILEKFDKLNKSNPLRYMINGTKIKSPKFCCIFTPWSGCVAIRRKKHLQQFLLNSLYLFGYFWSIVWINELNNCVEGIFSVFNKETKKKDSFSLFVLTVGKRKECFKKEKGNNFVDSNYHLKNTLEKMCLAFWNLKFNTYAKKSQPFGGQRSIRPLWKK